jgi:hypothetical protein
VPEDGEAMDEESGEEALDFDYSEEDADDDAGDRLRVRRISFLSHPESECKDEEGLEDFSRDEVFVWSSTEEYDEIVSEKEDEDEVEETSSDDNDGSAWLLTSEEDEEIESIQEKIKMKYVDMNEGWLEIEEDDEESEDGQTPQLDPGELRRVVRSGRAALLRRYMEEGRVALERVDYCKGASFYDSSSSMYATVQSFVSSIGSTTRLALREQGVGLGPAIEEIICGYWTGRDPVLDRRLTFQRRFETNNGEVIEEAPSGAVELDNEEDDEDTVELNKEEEDEDM